MNFIGKYVFEMPTPSGTAENTFLLRNYYDGTLHGTLLDAHGGIQLAKDVTAEDNILRFRAQAGPCPAQFTLELWEDGTSFTGTAEILRGSGEPATAFFEGVKTDITPEDDGADRIEMKGRALILYATITKNTEKVAGWFKETFQHYGMEVNMVRVLNGDRWIRENEGKLYFEDYDIVCMGSPIIGGSPMKCMLSHFSAGAASSLEDNVTKNAEAGLSFNAGGAGNFRPDEVKGGPGTPPPPPEGPEGPPPEMRSVWNREPVMPYPGGPHYPDRYKPLGIVFSTYGGGFSGPAECLPTLALLKMYMEDKGARVIGRFACPGKEFGPAGLDDGDTPVQINEPPVYYKDADGNYHAGAFFFHCHANSRPGPREEAQAKAFIADIVEDHFYTADGKVRKDDSEYVSIT